MRLVQCPYVQAISFPVLCGCSQTPYLCAIRVTQTSFAASPMNVQHAPVTYPNAPLIFVALQLFASWRPRGIAGSTSILRSMRANHAGGGFQAARRGTTRKECLFPCGAIQNQRR